MTPEEKVKAIVEVAADDGSKKIISIDFPKVHAAIVECEIHMTLRKHSYLSENEARQVSDYIKKERARKGCSRMRQPRCVIDY